MSPVPQKVLSILWRYVLLLCSANFAPFDDLANQIRAALVCSRRAALRLFEGITIKWRRWVLALLLGLGLAVSAVAKDFSLTADANVQCELTFIASRTYADPFNDVTVDVVFIDPQGRELRVPTFWAGKNIWKARYASPVVGTHRFRSECAAAQDKGLHGVTGRVEIKPYTGINPIYVHGPLRLSSNRRFLEHADGTPFFWLGDTWWMGLCHRMSWPEDFQKLAADRKEKGFNVIQIVAGLYPDMHLFDPRGANEAGHPWETNYARIRPEYFNAADQRLQYLVEEGFTPCIVGAWGYFMPWMGVAKAKQHWRNLVARYGALPVVWCVAGEANLPWYLSRGFPYDDRQQVKDWTEVTRYLRESDPFHRLITIHPTGIGRLSARHAMDDLSLIDIDMLQTPHGRGEAVAPTVRTVRESYADKPVLPVINGEASYEMLFDNLPTEWTRRMFWLSVMNGAAGHTYGANGIWQVNRRGQPHGPSPHHHGGDSYGKISWDEAMNLPGSRQVALGKKLLEQYPWQEFQPHPEWARFAAQSSLSFEGCQWIWYPEGNPAQNAPAEKRFFRRSFLLPEGKEIKSARLRVSVDDRFDARMNGKEIGGADSWKTGKEFNDLVPILKPGTNVVAIAAENLPANGANPAGLLARLEIHFANDESMMLVSDASWRCSTNATPGWDAAGFDATTWTAARVIGRHGDGPWGPIDFPGSDSIHGPQSSGIPGGLRVIYVPRHDAIVVNDLVRNAVYDVLYFDPVMGEKRRLAPIKTDKIGSRTFEAPTGQGSDWVLILDLKR